MKKIAARVGLIVFPATSIVIIAVSELERQGVAVSDAEGTAAAGLLMWLAFVLIGAGEKSDKSN